MTLNHRRGRKPQVEYAGPLWNRIPVLTMAAGHLHAIIQIRHQGAKEVAMPKLAERADLKEGASE